MGIIIVADLIMSLDNVLAVAATAHGHFTLVLFGIGLSIHAGMVVVADGTKEAEERLNRVLNYDPAMGIVRHADAGYEQAVDNAKKFGINMPMLK